MDKLLDVSIKQLKGLIIENEIALNRILDELYQLQQENKQLKELTDEYEKEHYTVFKEWLSIISEHQNYKNAWEELKNDNTELIEYENRTVKDCKLYKNKKMYLLEQKYNLGGK